MEDPHGVVVQELAWNISDHLHQLDEEHPFSSAFIISRETFEKERLAARRLFAAARMRSAVRAAQHRGLP